MNLRIKIIRRNFQTCNRLHLVKSLFNHLVGTASQKRGAALVYIVAAIGVLGAVVTAAVLQSNSGVVKDSERRFVSSKNFDRIFAALSTYAVQNNLLLPCPADGSEGTGQINNGIAVGNCSGANSYDTANVIPWKTLGLDERNVVDGWGNRLAYYVDPDATTGDGLRKADSELDDISVSSTATGQVVILISRGVQGDGAWTKNCQGDAGCYNVSAMQGTNELENVDADLVFAESSYNDTPGVAYFDDILAYRTKDQIAAAAQLDNEPEFTPFDSSGGGGNVVNGGENSGVVAPGGVAGSSCTSDCVGLLGDEDSEGDTGTGTSVHNGTACLWFAEAIPFTEYIRTGFEYTVSDLVGSSDLGGFTLTLFSSSAETSDADPTPIPLNSSRCGSNPNQRYLGHTNINNEGATEPVKLAIEFDTRTAGPSNDPGEEHIAIRWGDTDVHTNNSVSDCSANFISLDGSAEDDGDATNPDGSCSYDTTDPVGPNNARGWLEDSAYGDYVRIELNRCNSDCSTCSAGNSGGVLLKLLYSCAAALADPDDCENFSEDVLTRVATAEDDDADTNSDLFEFTSVTEGTGAYTLSACVPDPVGDDNGGSYDPGNLDSVYIGFTSGTAGTERPGVKLRNWGISSN